MTDAADPPVVSRSRSAGTAGIALARPAAHRYILRHGRPAAVELLDRQRAATDDLRHLAARHPDQRSSFEWRAQRIEVSSLALAAELGLAIPVNPATDGDGWVTAYAIEELGHTGRLVVQTHPTHGTRTVREEPF